jgi:hypothetical protein
VSRASGERSGAFGDALCVSVETFVSILDYLPPQDYGGVFVTCNMIWKDDTYNGRGYRVAEAALFANSVRVRCPCAPTMAATEGEIACPLVSYVSNTKWLEGLLGVAIGRSWWGCVLEAPEQVLARFMERVRTTRVTPVRG